jgi:hypothetical protein
MVKSSDSLGVNNPRLLTRHWHVGAVVTVLQLLDVVKDSAVMMHP